MIIAQALPDPNHFASVGWVCVILVAVITGLNQGIGFFRSLKDNPPPAEVARESAATFATKTEFNQHVEWNRREHENLFAKVGGVERGVAERLGSRLTEIEHKADASREKLHDRINEILASVSEVRGILSKLPCDKCE